MKISHSAPFLFFFTLCLAYRTPAVDANEFPRLFTTFFFSVYFIAVGDTCIIIRIVAFELFFFLPGLFTMLLYHVGQVCSKYVMVVKYDRVSWALCGISLAVHRLLLETLQIVIRDE